MVLMNKIFSSALRRTQLELMYYEAEAQTYD